MSRPWACQFSFYCDGKSDEPTDAKAWATAQTVAKEALSGATLGLGATHYHTKAVKPVWRHNLTPLGAIGEHVFYTDGKCLIGARLLTAPRGAPRRREPMTKQDEINDLKDCIASWRKQRDELELRYQGVRPSYVSTDLAILEERIQRYVAKLAEMEGEKK